MAGFGILLRKELLESWRTLRLPVVGGLFLVVGLTSPLLAKFLPEIVKAAGGDQLSGLQIPEPVVGDAVLQLWKNLGQFGAFAAIILAMGSVATERDRGTAAFVLSKTVSRGAFLGGQGRGHRPGPRDRGRAGRGGRLDLHRDPVRTAAGRRLDRARGHGLAGAHDVGGPHVPRQHGHRIGGGGGRARLHRLDRAVHRVGDPEPRPIPARAASMGRPCHWPQAARSTPPMS